MNMQSLFPIRSRKSRVKAKKDVSRGWRLGVESLETRAVFSATALTPDLDAASDTGWSATDDRTADTTPTFTIQASGDAASINLLRVAKVGRRTVTTPLASTSTGGGGSPFVATVSAPLAAGKYSIAAQAVDSQGVAGPVSRPLAVEIGTAAPAAPSISLDGKSDTGFRNDRITSVTNPLLVGRGQRGTIVMVSGPGIAGGSQALAVNKNGVWSIRPTGLPDGSHDYTAKAMNVFGVESGSSTLRITIDTVRPQVVAMTYLDDVNEIELEFSAPVRGVDVNDFRISAPEFGIRDVPLTDRRIVATVGRITVQNVSEGRVYRLRMSNPDVIGGTFTIRLAAAKSGIIANVSGNPLLVDRAISVTF